MSMVISRESLERPASALLRAAEVTNALFVAPQVGAYTTYTSSATTPSPTTAKPTKKQSSSRARKSVSPISLKAENKRASLSKQACIPCRKAKTKCNGDMELGRDCTRCSVKGTDCVWKDKRGSPTGSSSTSPSPTTSASPSSTIPIPHRAPTIPNTSPTPSPSSSSAAFIHRKPTSPAASATLAKPTIRRTQKTLTSPPMPMHAAPETSMSEVPGWTQHEAPPALSRARHPQHFYLRPSVSVPSTSSKGVRWATARDISAGDVEMESGDATNTEESQQPTACFESESAPRKAYAVTYPTPFPPSSMSVYEASEAVVVPQTISPTPTPTQEPEYVTDPERMPPFFRLRR